MLAINRPLCQESAMCYGVYKIYEYDSGSTLLRTYSILGSSQVLFLFVFTMLLKMGCSILDSREGNGNRVRLGTCL